MSLSPTLLLLQISGETTLQNYKLFPIRAKEKTNQSPYTADYEEEIPTSGGYSSTFQNACGR